MATPLSSSIITVHNGRFTPTPDWKWPGPSCSQRYQRLETAIREDQAGWQGRLDRIGRPVILVDHEFNAAIGATLIRDPHWRCVWFDAIAAVFVHDSATEAVRQHTVDFAARHFRPAPDAESRDIPELTASASALRHLRHGETVPTDSQISPGRSPGSVWTKARRILRAEPDSADGWKLAGQIELCREPPPNSPRFRLPFDPVLDLSIVRATYALRHGWELSPSDFTTLWMLNSSYEQRLMYEAALPVTEQLVSRYPINQVQAIYPTRDKVEAARVSEEDGHAPVRRTGGTWPSSIGSSRRCWPRAGPRAPRTCSRKATRRSEYRGRPSTGLQPYGCISGSPHGARALWQKATSGPESAIAMARIGATYLVEGNFEAARRAYREALQARPDLFEACYSLAVLEQDAGDATASYELARKAIAMARDDLSRTAARTNRHRRRALREKTTPALRTEAGEPAPITLRSWRRGPASPGRLSSRCTATSAPRRSLRRGPRPNPSAA